MFTHVKSVIITSNKLELGGEIADSAAQNAK